MLIFRLNSVNCNMMGYEEFVISRTFIFLNAKCICSAVRFRLAEVENLCTTTSPLGLWIWKSVAGRNCSKILLEMFWDFPKSIYETIPFHAAPHFCSSSQVKIAVIWNCRWLWVTGQWVSHECISAALQITHIVQMHCLSIANSTGI